MTKECGSQVQISIIKENLKFSAKEIEEMEQFSLNQFKKVHLTSLIQSNSNSVLVTCPKCGNAWESQLRSDSEIVKSLRDMKIKMTQAIKMQGFFLLI